MTGSGAVSRFKAKLLRPAQPGAGGEWAFLVLPKTASNKLPRRGRTTVAGTLNGHPFQATLDPDGRLSHWMKVDEKLRKAAKVKAGDIVALEVSPVEPEPEPRLPPDLKAALAASPKARATWKGTTTIARLDWVHWITTAKQQATRKRRIENACHMLAAGKQRVCCFDPSGYYSKGFSAPEPAG